MKLLKLNYSQWEQQPKEWKIEDLNFEDINLIVGINATGKTRLLNVIGNFARIISGKRNAATGNFFFEYLDDEKNHITYELNSVHNQIKKEEFKINNTTLLIRNEDGSGEIFAEELDKNIKFGLGKNQLAFSTKRDTVQHPFLESLAKWAENVRHYKFAEDQGMGRNQLLILSEDKDDDSTADSLHTKETVKLFYRGDSKFSGFRQSIIQDFKAIGYAVNDIEVKELKAIQIEPPILTKLTKPLGLVVKEKGLGIDTEQIEMSQGMFRALSILIHVNYLSFSDSSSCTLIDDIGEGLDFDRSRKLIKLLIDKASSNKFQLIMTTNDRFVMNGVPLKYWAVLIRSGGICKALDYQNSKEIIDEFELTGLNNFDFFASKYWETELQEDE